MSVANERGTPKRGNSRGRAAGSRSNGSGSSRSSGGGSSRSNGSGSAASAKRGRTASSSSSRTKSASTRNGASGSRSGAGTGAKQAQRQTANGAESAKSRASQTTKSNGAPAQLKTPVAVGASVLTGAVGIAGGVLLGRAKFSRRRGIPVPVPSKVDLSGVSHSIGDAARQFGKLAGEVKSVREKAEQIAKVLG